MSVKNIDVPDGTQYHRTFKGVSHTLTVVVSDTGATYVLDGVHYKSPTAAAMAVTGHNTNGWRFWHMRASS